jgi:teichuronic acid biosynthesis glycosyltransferase TuaC
MKPKILTFTTVYPTPSESGFGVFVERRVQHLAKLTEVKVLAPVPVIRYRGHVVEVRRSVPARSWQEIMEVIRPRWFYPPGGGALNAAFLFLRIIWPAILLRRRYPFDIIDVHFGHPEGVSAALLSFVCRCPFTITIRGSERIHAQHKFRRLSIRWALQRAGRVIAVAESLKKFAIDLGVDASRVVVIPNGVDTNIFHPRDRASGRPEYGLSSAAKLIVSAGHLIQLKGHHRIIDALRELVDSGIDVELAIAGGAGRAENYEPALRKRVVEHGLETRVKLLGHLNQEALANLISAADVFCLASRSEGWPNVVHEALACGTPVVATNVGGVPEMIPSEQYGIIVPVDDAGALTSALSRSLLVSWDHKLIASWGQSRSWDQVASEVLRIIQQVQAEKRIGN